MKNIKGITAWIFILISLSISTISAQIQSISGSGLWNEETTWVGGVVPGANDDVVINGNIELKYSTTIRNLTINSVGILSNMSGWSPDLQVSNLTNNGTFKNNADGWYIDLYCKGNVVNNGTFTSSYLTFNSESNQYMGGSSEYNIQYVYKNPNGDITASSNLFIGESCSMQLGNDVLHMNNYKLTVKSTKERHFYGGTVHSNGEIDVTGPWGANLDGNFTLVGSQPMQLKNSFTCHGNFTVGTGKIIENLDGYSPDVFVLGNIVNNGTIRNNEEGWYIDLYCKGNVVNNANMTGSYLTFNSESNQYIGGTSEYNIQNVYKNPNGHLTASSNLLIGSNCSMQLGNDTLYMGNYKLTANSTKEKYFYGGTVHSNNEIDVTGPWGSNLDGNFTLVGSQAMQLKNSFTCYGNFTVGSGKIIENLNAYSPDVFVLGNIVNNGTIRNNPEGWYIDLYCKGNVINNANMTGSYLTFNSESNQYMGGTSEYNIQNVYKNPNGYLTASSNLLIGPNCSMQLGNDTLYMGNYKLIANSTNNKHFYGGTVNSNGEIDVTGAWGSNLDGDPILTGENPMQFKNSFTSYGNLTIGTDKIIENLVGYSPDVFVKGTLSNYGTIRNNSEGWYIDWYADGDVYNYGTFTSQYITFRSDGSVNKIAGEFNSNVYLYRLGETENSKYSIDGNFTNHHSVNIDNYTNVSIPFGSSLNYVGNTNNSGKITNEGKLSITYARNYNGELPKTDELYSYFYIRDHGDVDTFNVTVNNNESYATMSSSIKRWWSFNGNGDVVGYYITLYYDDSILNGQDENSLNVFLTQDGGDSWQQISNPVNTTHDKENNTITVGTYNVPLDVGFGDIIVSSGNLALVPQIGSAITGRTNIRVGPPNYYDITYWNNSDFYTDQFVVLLNTYNGVHIQGITTTEIESGTKVTLPIDSLTYDGINDEVYLLVEPLAPGEIRSFSVNLGALPDAAAQKAMFEPFSLTAAAIWIGGAVLTDYVGNVVVEGCYEMWRPVSHDESLTDASVTALKNSMKKAATFENGGKSIAKKAVEEIGKKTGKFVAWPVFLAKDIYDCLGNTFKGMRDYVNGNFDKKGKKLNKVTSWDPNAKEGPTGFGDNGYMASADPMNYTIFFENKKEATAPAWKIVVLDTLDENVYDVESVQFGAMSHDMGVATREGNVLKWEFVEIELPPNATPPEGEGYVKFTVNLKPNLPTGTEIKNRAVITFDLNKPIATNVALNTLDFDPPKSTPGNISYNSNKGEVTLNWQVDDKNGSGQKVTKIYMSKNDAPYEIAGKSETSEANIAVVPNASYKFYLLTEDNVGNIEIEPSELFTIVSVEDEEIETIPTVYSLGQNYPNPFNPTTVIEYSIPEAVKVELKIFDLLGREVITLVNREQNAGNYKVDFDASKLSSGIYFYNINAGKFNKTMKMILLK